MDNELSPKIPSTGEEYIEVVNKMVGLIDAELKRYEDLAKEDLGSIVTQMPALISLVNTAGYLRGQDGIFSEIRPLTPEFTAKLYKMEADFERRLQALIEQLKNSKFYEHYQERMSQYYIKART